MFYRSSFKITSSKADLRENFGPSGPKTKIKVKELELI